MDCSPPDSSAHEVIQARILEWIAMPFSRGSSWLGDQTCVSWVSCIGRWVLYHQLTWEALRVDLLVFCTSSPLPFGFKCEFPLCQLLYQRLLGSELKKSWCSFSHFLRAASALIRDVWWVLVLSPLIFLAFFSQSSCLCSCGFKSSAASLPLSIIFSFGFLLALESLSHVLLMGSFRIQVHVVSERKPALHSPDSYHCLLTNIYNFKLYHIHVTSFAFIHLYTCFLVYYSVW